MIEPTGRPSGTIVNWGWPDEPASVSRYMSQRQEVLLPDNPLVRVQEFRRTTLASDVILRLLGVRCLKQPALI